ncbi:hypothetical protein [Sphingomonas sp.]|uniref:hypothetical protein n=1 Tax=Sphingomonas sp. TaxID=28214 RepID=UPI001B05A6BF|nr:hypothetical protein [Sphingomonas sp.]MBO9714828.1 hypothetical protein [Sphingomonas sp.]
MFGFGKKRTVPAEVKPSDIGLLIDARVKIQRELHEGRLAEENARVAAAHPGASLATQFILTDDIWNGRHSAQLMGALELTPFDAFNVRFLPADEASAAILGQPYAYRGQFAEVVRGADDLIAQIFEAEGLPADPFEALGAPEAVKNEVRRNLAGLTNYLYEEHILPTLRSAG